MAYKEDKTQDYKDAFDSLRGEGETVATSELPHILRAFGFTFTDKDFSKVTAGVGKDSFSFDEFIGILKQYSGKRVPISEEDVNEAFWVFDREDNGLMSLEEFKYVMQTTLGEPLTDAEVAQLVKSLDVGSAGGIQYSEIAKVFATKRIF